MDITMCTNKTCPLRKDCYRYRAVPDDMLQSYAGFKYDEEKNACVAFISIAGFKYLKPFKEDEKQND